MALYPFSLLQVTVQPEFGRIKEVASRDGCKMIPVYASIPSDTMTVTAAYLKLAEGSKYSFLFESVTGGEQLGRYSYFGANPQHIVKTGAGHGEEVDPLLDLEKRVRESRAYGDEGLPPFTGGAIGYIGYDCIRYFEPKSRQTELENVLSLPESYMMYYDSVVAMDNIKQTTKVISHVYLPADATELRAAYDAAVSRVQDMCRTLLSERVPIPPQPPIDLTREPESASNVGRDGYKSFVSRLKEHIYKGDIIQAVPSQRIARPSQLHPFNLYRHLRSINPSPYMFYLDCGGEFQVVGASPELLVKAEPEADGTRIVTHPIAGTIRRGKTREEDDSLAQELLGSVKDRAEHVMLVDLARNDVNRICQPHTTRVDRLMVVERFSHVMHLVSEVSGYLRDGCTRFDAFRSIFPAGTVSGAPKVKAMELIGRLERQMRGVYAGAVGRWSYASESMDTCIALRTMVCKDGVIYLQAGGGIVFDSDEEDEYVETLNKLKGNVAAISAAEAYYASGQ